jgi:lipoyl(octanoyl) transferase
VITLGKSASLSNLISTEAELSENNIEVFNINRGGDVTYHGPGQLTGYLIMDLELLYRDVHKYVRNIEECIIRLLSKYDIVGHRHDDYTGVWITDDHGSRKICAIGVHLSRWVSMHGFGFNINTDLSKFNNIIPCGIDEKGMTVTSLAQELGYKVPMTEVKDQLQLVLEEVFGIKIIH